MLHRLCFAALTVVASPLVAEETRQLDAHEHGVGQLDIAMEGNNIGIMLHAPGADIVGFEYAATSAEDRAAVDNAVAVLARPLDLFVLPAAAGCSVTQASASLESEEDEHDEHGHEDHGHEEHAEDDHEDHSDDDHKEHAHDEHADDDHEEHADEASHTEFHAEYLLECANPDAVSEVTFAYFDTFPNAQELEVQVLSDAGVKAFEVERDAPTLDLPGMF